MPHLSVAPYPDLDLYVFSTAFPAPLGAFSTPTWLTDLFKVDAKAPFSRNEDTRKTVRDLLRHEGYKPTGRGKPASEYLVRAAEQGYLRSINLAVDACNAVSLHSGLPISVVDIDLLYPPCHVAPGAPDVAYIFNASGQVIKVAGLLCLHDQEGPCANAVKDAQRAKTHEGTSKTLTLIWGTQTLDTAAVGIWYRSLLEKCGATTTRWSAIPMT